jgi:hypothetical protein
MADIGSWGVFLIAFVGFIIGVLIRELFKVIDLLDEKIDEIKIRLRNRRDKEKD